MAAHNVIRDLTHSVGVAAVARELTEIAGYSERKYNLMNIMDVANAVTYLTEEGLYRSGMKKDRVTRTLRGMAENKCIDGEIVKLANENFPRINAARIRAQKEARSVYC